MIENDTIYDWIKFVTGYPDDNIIKANQSGNRPIGPYATYYLVAAIPSDSSAMQKKLSADELFVERTFYNRVTLTISVDVYESRGAEILLAAAQSGATQEARIILAASNLTLIKGGTPRAIPEPGDTEYRERYNADFDFYWYSEIGETIDRILEMVLGGDFVDDQGNEDHEEIEVFSIEVTP